ncbi:hypothetical protein BJX62DRAFT_244870 [Aspergillus germanicus]
MTVVKDCTIRELGNGFWTGHGLVNGKWREASTFGPQETPRSTVCPDPDVYIFGGLRLGYKGKPRARRIRARPGKTYIILDGIDEIPYGPKRSRVLTFLDEISRLQNPQVHMIACSRQERDIESVLLSSTQWKPLRISHADVETDLDIYITSQIAADPKLHGQPENIKEEIKDKLAHGADGI